MAFNEYIYILLVLDPEPILFLLSKLKLRPAHRCPRSFTYLVVAVEAHPDNID
jgi:hypothetical protein